MEKRNIVYITNNSIQMLLDTFKKSPTLFLTKNDVVSYFYYIFQMQKELKLFPPRDKDHKLHFLIHMEFPLLLGEKQSNCDVVVLNPEFIKNVKFQDVKAQDYSNLKSRLNDKISPMIIYGLEFMYQSGPFESASQIDTFAKEVIQDTDKLAEYQKQLDGGFVENIKMVVLVKDKENQALKDKLNRPEIIIRFAE